MHSTSIQLLVYKVGQQIAWLVEAQGYPLTRQRTAELCQGFFYDCLYLPEEYRAMVTPTRISLTSPQLEEAIDELATIVNELMDIHEKKFIAHAHLLEMLDQAILAEYHGCTLLKIPAKLL